MKTKPTRELAQKVLDIVDKGLVKGLGVQEPGKMCIEAAVCYALGLPHTDKPPCVGEAVRRFKINLNDARWPSDKDRTEGMRQLSVAQLGSNEIDQREFANIVVLETIKQIVPMTFRYAIENSTTLTKEDKKKFEVCAKNCEAVTDLKEGWKAALEARNAAAATYAAAADAAAAAADAAADAATYAAAADAAAAAAAAADAAAAAAAATYAADAATYAAAAAAADAAAAAAAATYAAADAAAAAAAADAAAAAAAATYAAADAAAKKFRLDILKTCAKIGLTALITLHSPGADWLDLCD